MRSTATLTNEVKYLITGLEKDACRSTGGCLGACQPNIFSVIEKYRLECRHGAMIVHYAIFRRFALKKKVSSWHTACRNLFRVDSAHKTFQTTAAVITLDGLKDSYPNLHRKVQVLVARPLLLWEARRNLTG